MRKETEVLLKVCKHKEQKAAFILRTVLQNLVKQVTHPFNFRTCQTLNYLTQVVDPYIIDMRPAENLNASFIHPEALFIEIIGLQKAGEVENCFWSSNLQVDDTIVGYFSFFKSTTVLQQVEIERPGSDVVDQTTGLLVFALEFALRLVAGVLYDLEGRVDIICADMHLGPAAEDKGNLFN